MTSRSPLSSCVSGAREGELTTLDRCRLVKHYFPAAAPFGSISFGASRCSSEVLI